MNLRDYLKEKKISLSALSKETGVSYKTLSRLVNGKSSFKNCKVGTALKLSEALGISLNDLLLGEIKGHHFINDSVILNTNALPKPLYNCIKELDEYDQNEDGAFFAMADTMLLMADRMFSSGLIDKETHSKLYDKYPLCE